MTEFDGIAAAGRESDALLAACDILFDHLHEVIRAAKRSGLGPSRIAEVTGYSQPQIYSIAGKARPVVRALPCTDSDLSRAAEAAAAVDRAYVTARRHRDGLIAGAVQAGTPPQKVAQVTGLNRAQIRKVVADPVGAQSSRPGKALRGGSVPGWRVTRNARDARRRADIRAGRAKPTEHGLVGYNQGCLCETCVRARRAYDGDRPD